MNPPKSNFYYNSKERKVVPIRGRSGAGFTEDTLLNRPLFPLPQLDGLLATARLIPRNMQEAPFDRTFHNIVALHFAIVVVPLHNVLVSGKKAPFSDRE